MSLAFVAILMRAVVPTGWMLAPDAETGDISIQLCSGRTVYWNPDSGSFPNLDHSDDDVSPHTPTDTDNAISNCPFAMATSLIVPSAASYRVYSVSYQKIAHIRPPVRGPPPYKVISAPLPARGPPLYT